MISGTLMDRLHSQSDVAWGTMANGSDEYYQE